MPRIFYYCFSILLTGCTKPLDQEVDIRFTPTANMYLSYLISTKTKLGEQSDTESRREVIEIKDIAKDGSFGVRVTEDGKTLPVTSRFSRDLTFQNILFDEEEEPGTRFNEAMRTMMTTHMKHTMENLMQSLRDIGGQWKSGQSKPLSTRINILNIIMNLDGTRTFRRIVQIEERSAAEFDERGTIVGQAVGLPGSVILGYQGQLWIDLLNGVTLKTSHIMAGGFVRNEQMVTIRLQEDRHLDLTESKGLIVLTPP